MAIDQNAMFRAGLGSKAKRNIDAEKRDKRVARFNTVANTAYSLLGKAALGQLSQNYQMLQQYRNQADNYVGALGLQMDKMPKNNPGLREDLETLSKLHSEANKRANFGIGGKKRAQARQDAAGYRQQLTDLKQAMEVVSKQAIEAQGMVGIDSGLVQAGGDQASMSSGASVYAQGNTIALAEGSLLQRARWNSDATKGPIGLNVLVGGEYRDGKYVDKLEAGTYEDYVERESKPEEVMGSRAQVDLAGNPIETPYEESETGKYAKESLSSTTNKNLGSTSNSLMSREEWTKQQQQNRGLISQTPWSTLKFAEKEDKTTSKNLAEYTGAKIQDANSRNSLTWDQVTENEKEEFVAKMDEYTDLQFRDYFFGGGTFTASATRMPNSAPAYLFLKEEDEKNGNFKDGEFKEGFGPGSEDWSGRVLSLQGQSFVKGSRYRKTTAEQQWDVLGEKYKTNRKNWKIANPEKNSGGGGGYYGGRKAPLSVQQSRQKAAAIDKIVGSKINEQGIKSLELELGARTTVTTLRGENARKAEVADGTIQIMDSADNAYMINPNDPIDARSILYGLAKINQEDRDEQIMGIASDANDPKTGKTKNDYFNMITN